MPVATGAMVLGGIQAVGGFMSSQKSRKEMKKMRKLMEKQLAFAKDQWGHYRETYGNLEKQMVADAMYGVQGDYEGVRSRAAADVEGSFRAQQEQLDRQNMAYGLNPNSGRFQSSKRMAGLTEAATSAMAQNNARETERNRVKDDTWNRRYSLGTFGAGLTKSAGNDVMRATENLGRSYERSGMMQSELAGNLFANAGMMGMYGLSRGGGTTANLDGFSGMDLDRPFVQDYGFNPTASLNQIPNGGINMESAMNISPGGMTQGLTNYSMR